MRLLTILLITSSAYAQSDFILPSDFVDNPPNLPNVVLPSFDDSSDYDNKVKSLRTYVTFLHVQ